MKENNKVDTRVSRTKKLLKSALCELAKTKPIEKITIKEITDKSGVARGTFYLHYNSIYEMRNEIVDDALNYTKELLSVYHGEYTTEIYQNVLSDLADYFYNDLPRCYFLFSNQHFRNEFAKEIEDVYYYLWKKETNVDLETADWEMLIGYHLAGLEKCIDFWIADEQRFTKAEFLEMLAFLDAEFDKVIGDFLENKARKLNSQ